VCSQLNGRALRVEHLACCYDSRCVLKDINLEVKPGEAIAIIGGSGAGKTTLAYCLTGIIPHKVPAEVSGRITINGINVLEARLDAILESINIVLEDADAQSFGLTVEEDIVFGLENLGLSREEISRRLEESLVLFNLKPYAKNMVSSLSGGLKRRLAIASVYAMRPSFLVLDAPDSNLDWPGTNELSLAISRLKERSHGVVVLLRRYRSLGGTIDRFYTLEDGVLKQARPPSGVGVGVKSAERPCRRGNGWSGEPIIKIENVWFKYSGPWVLRDVNLNVNSGEILTIMGRNGSGKTTLLKLLNGLLKPTRGRVIIDGKDTRLTSTSQLARTVALAFQDPSRRFFAETVWEEVSFGCRHLGLPLEWAKEALMALDIEDLHDKPVYKLSMSEKVRVMIASALAVKPKVLVLDEPTTGQDDKVLKDLAAIACRMRESGKAVVIVTHDTDFAIEVSDRVVVLIDGGIAWSEKPWELILEHELLERAGLEPPTVTRSFKASGVVRECLHIQH